MKTANKKIRRKSTSNNHKLKCARFDSHKTITKLIAEAHNYQVKQQLEQANFLYQQVLSLEAGNIIALNALGLIAMNTGMLQLAAEFFNTAHAVDKNQQTVNKNLALVYSKLADYAKAIHYYAILLRAYENNAEFHGEIARLYLLTGDTKKATVHYRYAFKLQPQDPRNFHGLAHIDVSAISQDDIDIIEKHLLSPKLALETRSRFYFTLADVYHHAENYDKAFANYAVANLSKAASFNRDKHAAMVTDIMQTFSQDFFNTHPASDLHKATQPVFIIGMPDSGCQQVAELLAAHKNTYVVGELELISDIAHKLNINKSTMLENNAGLLFDCSRSYLNQVNKLAFNGNDKIPEKIIDSKATNFLHLGLISLLFPHAKIIHCKRNAVDTCVSNYRKDFSQAHDYAYDQENIAAYYFQYQRLMQHWQDCLPVQIHDIEYEELQASAESVSRDLFNFVGFNWKKDYLKSTLASSSYKQFSAAEDSHYKEYLPLFIKPETPLIQDESSSNSVVTASAKA